MKLQDIIDLAKAGYGPKDVMTLLEYVEASPKVQDAKPEDVDKAKAKAIDDADKKEQPKDEPPKVDENESAFAKLAERLKEGGN